MRKTILLAVLTACILTGQQAKRVDDAVLKNAAKSGDEWLTYGQSPSETRYSPLKQIDATNVSRLGLAWSYDVGQGGQSGGDSAGLERDALWHYQLERCFR